MQEIRENETVKEMVESKEDIDNKNEIGVKPTQQEIHTVLKLITFSNFSTLTSRFQVVDFFKKH